MSDTITRIYGSAENAKAAIQQLGVQGFRDDQITSSANSRNQWSVSVRAPFGMGSMAEDTLDEFGPIIAVRPNSREPDLEAISRLSGRVSPGAISRLSAFCGVTKNFAAIAIRLTCSARRTTW